MSLTCGVLELKGCKKMLEEQYTLLLLQSSTNDRNLKPFFWEGFASLFELITTLFLVKMGLKKDVECQYNVCLV